MTRYAETVLLFVSMAAMGCSTKDTECKTLVSTMRSLGKKLAATQRLTSGDDAGAERVANALRAFAQTATTTGETLRDSPPTVPDLGRIANDAAGAALSLGDSATKMVEIAKRMKELEAARNTTRIQKTLTDVAVANIHRLCAVRSAECTRISKTLQSRPRFPETSMDSARVAAWMASMTSWLAELATLKSDSPELKHQLDNLEQTSKAFASAFATLAVEHDLARDLTAATKAFDSQVVTLDSTMSATRAFCKN